MIDPSDLRDVFDRAASLPPVDRAAFLERVCGEDRALRREVERLLAADARIGSVFEPSASGSDGDEPGAGMEHPRSLVAGTHLGPYVVEALVGAGGMGEVYRAHDTRLGRTVAIKVLPVELTQDPTARQRFEREARAAAALAHPHICRLLDIGRERDVDFLVMEYLEGETLAARLQRGKLPLGDSLALGLQVAAALAAAHRAGIVHRDLKPGNIMLAREGAMLLDFGLARHLPSAATEGTTATVHNPITRTGMILGTVQYMAPEQLDGRDSDAHTDIFAFGVVLYEMVTGRRAFEGTTQATLIGNILHADPPSMSVTAPHVPPALDRLIRRCLAKDPSERWASMADVHSRLEALQDLLRDGSGTRPVETIAAPGITRGWLGAFAGAAAIIAVAASGWWAWRKPSVRSSDASIPSPAVQRNLTRLTFDAGLQTDPSFSPDGRFMAYGSDKGGNFDIWVQPVAGGEAIRVTNSPAADTQPAWSPDGSTIAFRSERDGGGLFLVSAFGGKERLLVNRGVHPSWSPDGKEVWFLSETFVDYAATLFRVPLTGDAPRQVLPEFTASGSWSWIGPRSDGRISFLGSHRTQGFGLFTVTSDGHVTASKWAGPPFDNPGVTYRRFVWNNTGTALCIETGTGLQTLWLVRIDPSTLAIRSAERLTTGAASDVVPWFSPDGARLLFSSQHVSERLWQFPLATARAPLGTGRPMTDDGALIGGSDVSPDGTSAVYFRSRPGERDTNMWLTNLATGRTELFAENAEGAAWSRDSREVVYVRVRWAPVEVSTGPGSTSTSLAVRSISGPERLISPWRQDPFLWPTDWIADHKTVLATRQATDHQADLVTWPVSDPSASAASRIVLAVPDASVWEGKVSPNGRWLSFVAVLSKNRGARIGVTSLDGPPERSWQGIAPEVAWVDKPRWARDGRTLYFLAARPSAYLNLMGVAFDPEQGVPVGPPFQISDFSSPSFAISPAIQRTTVSIAKDQIFLTMAARAGNIWMLDNVDR